jgi:hypothetical protein
VYARQTEIAAAPGKWVLPITAHVAWGTVHDEVTLEAVPQPFGGVRWWWRCSGCGSKRRSLYLVPNALVVRCRRCFRLGYLSQRLGRFDRLTLNARALGEELGSPDLDDVLLSGTSPPRPRGMHRRRYRRTARELRRVLRAREVVFLTRALTILNRSTGRRR